MNVSDCTIGGIAGFVTEYVPVSMVSSVPPKADPEKELVREL